MAAFVAIGGSRAVAHDWYVDASYSNCSGSDGSASKPYCTINGALAVASSGDTIWIAAGTYVEHLDLVQSLELVGTSGAATTVVTPPPASSTSYGGAKTGPGTTVDLVGLTVDCGPNGQLGVWVDSGGTVSATDCVFSSCQPAVYSPSASTVTLERCTAKNCRGNYGAVVDASGGTLTVLDCTVTGSNPVYEGSVFADHCTVDLERTTFSTNTSSSDAAALYAQNSSVVTASRCSFTGNVTNLLNGAVVGDSTSSLTFTDCTFENNQGVAGGAAHVSSASFERCTFRGNVATTDPTVNVNGGRGGAVQVVGQASFVDCVFEDNSSAAGVLGAGVGGALALESSSGGSVTLTRCSFRGNLADGCGGFLSAGGIGGALYFNAAATLVDCEILENVATNTHTTKAGRGGGVFANQALTLTRTTIAGNSAISAVGPPTKYGTGGGIFVTSTATVTIDGSIVAANVAGDPHGAPDVDGTIDSNGWNCLGDTTGTTITGPGTNDLLDVDPLFADPANGDYSLSASSPCVESGDPSVASDDRDVGGFSRVLDADLDRVRVVDRGAREWSNVVLAISGTPTPGATLTVDTTGTSGLVELLFVGTSRGEVPLAPYGTLFVDLAQTWVVVPWGVVPNSQPVDVDPLLAVPVTFEVQAVGLGTRDGNFSNVVELVFD